MVEKSIIFLLLFLLLVGGGCQIEKKRYGWMALSGIYIYVFLGVINPPISKKSEEEGEREGERKNCKNFTQKKENVHFSEKKYCYSSFASLFCPLFYVRDRRSG